MTPTVLARRRDGCPNFFLAAVSAVVAAYFLFLSPPQRRCTTHAVVSGDELCAEVLAVAAREAESAGGNSLDRTEGARPRRLSSIIKKFVVWDPVERLMPSLNLDQVVFIAGKHRADLSSVFHTTLDDVLTLFLRWFDTDARLAWAVQGFITEAALLREHVRYQEQMIQEYSDRTSEHHADTERNKNKILSLEVYTYLAAIKRRLRDWSCDGNAFHRTGPEGLQLAQKAILTERDAGFFRGLPFSVLRLARGVYAENPPATVERLREELLLRGVQSLDDLLVKTNFIDMFLLFNILDEAFTQLDVLREFVRSWESYRLEGVVPPLLPAGRWEGSQSLQELMSDDQYPSTKFPKCSTLTCVMQHTWAENASDVFTIEKENVNSLKLLLLGSTGISEYKTGGGRKGLWYNVKRFFWTNEFDQTVEALKHWHVKEKADAVLGLGDFLGIPGPLSARDERFTKKWHDIFVKDAGLDVPWLMTLGDDEALVNPSASIRHHYTGQHPNWHMPNDAYTVTFNFSADMRMADGSIERETFNATVINLNTWNLLVGNPIANNMQSMMDRLMWLSDELYTAINQKTNWLIVMGHHPILSTGPQGEQSRLQYIDDLYRNGQPRGTESLLVQMLLTHYQVDAYISGHDYFMEYNTLEDLNRNTTLAFITSGAASRLLDKDVGRGWIGRLRGAMHPILCWSGRRILFALHPGGCRPERRDQDYAYRFFAPMGTQFKVNVVERVTTATGFAAVKLTQDYMVVEFIDGRSQKLATRRINKRSNKGQRDIQYMDPMAEGRLRYGELELERQAFAEANEELLQKEVTFARQCPVLAQRIRFYVTEINDLVSRYEELGKQKDAYEVMDENNVELMMAQGINIVSRITQATSEMHVLASDYEKMMKKYRELLAVKATMPAADDPRYLKLFQLEKAYVDTRKMRQEMARQLALEGEGVPDREGEKELERLILSMQVLRKEITAIEKDMQDNPFVPTEEPPEASEGEAEEAGERGEGGEGGEAERGAAESGRSIKWPDNSLVARIERKREQLRKTQLALELVKRHPPEELEKIKTQVRQLEQLAKATEDELRAMEQRLQRQQEPMAPSRAWDLFQQRQDLETKLAQIGLLLVQVQKLPEEVRTSPEAQKQVEMLRAQKTSIEQDFRDINDELGERTPTDLQTRCLKKKAEVWRMETILAQESLLPARELAIPAVRQALNTAKQAIGKLRAELQELEERVRQELTAREAAFVESLQAQGLPLPKAEDQGGSVDDAQPLMQPDFTRGSQSRADALIYEFNETEKQIAAIDEVLRVSKELSPEELQAVEGMVGPIKDLPARRAWLEKRLIELKAQAEKEAEAGETGTTEGNAGRRLLDFLDMRREPTPYKHLDKVDVGPIDACLQAPMLQAHVEMTLRPDLREQVKEKCIMVFAQTAYQTQYRVIQPVHFFVQSQKGLQTLLYRVPSVHVSRAWNQYFGSTRNTRFKTLMKELKSGVKFVHDTFRSLSIKEAQELEGLNGAQLSEGSTGVAEEAVPTTTHDSEKAGDVEGARADEGTEQKELRKPEGRAEQEIEQGRPR
ncbi:acid phosphatase [Besnoitia besnoiti]|uniref:Acid phosphatase n=1 Tax=Besnoitia besnoiti TaxID=94643 RepID=A0A2A9MHV3_BESBE|nr:acid phosphatase [Besnoitia besnoiti]PFH34990.1 acid phosphatase [Besnoitia besnoiti]